MEYSTGTVTMVLAIGTVIMPILFGFIIYKMSTIFVTKEDWTEWKKGRSEIDHDFKEEIKGMENKIDKVGDKIDKLLMK